MANPTFAKEVYTIKSSTLLQVLDTLSDCMLIEEVNPDKVSNTCELLQIEMESQEVKEGPECAD